MDSTGLAAIELSKPLLAKEKPVELEEQRNGGPDADEAEKVTPLSAREQLRSLHPLWTSVSILSHVFGLVLLRLALRCEHLRNIPIRLVVLPCFCSAVTLHVLSTKRFSLFERKLGMPIWLPLLAAVARAFVSVYLVTALYYLAVPLYLSCSIFGAVSHALAGYLGARYAGAKIKLPGAMWIAALFMFFSAIEVVTADLRTREDGKDAMFSYGQAFMIGNLGSSGVLLTNFAKRKYGASALQLAYPVSFLTTSLLMLASLLSDHVWAPLYDLPLPSIWEISAQEWLLVSGLALCSIVRSVAHCCYTVPDDCNLARTSIALIEILLIVAIGWAVEASAIRWSAIGIIGTVVSLFWFYLSGLREVQREQNEESHGSDNSEDMRA